MHYTLELQTFIGEKEKKKKKYFNNFQKYVHKIHNRYCVATILKYLYMKTFSKMFVTN